MGFAEGKILQVGSRNLHVAVDCKPLLGLYRPNHQLSDVENPRLVSLVEKTARFQFTAFHILRKRMRQLMLCQDFHWDMNVSLRLGMFRIKDSFCWLM